MLYCITKIREEGFSDGPPLPHEIFKHLRGLLDKYDRPEVWNHAIQMANKSPTDLAREQLMAEEVQGK